MPVPDGVANCQWLKISVTAKMIEVLDDNMGLGAKHTSKAVCYLQLQYTPPDPNNPELPHGQYTGPVLCQNDGNGDWVMSGPDDSFVATALGDGTAIMVDGQMTFTNMSGDVIYGFGTHVLRISVDKTGAFHGATFQTLSSDLVPAPDGTAMFFLTNLPVIGGYTSKGTSVPLAKVPAGAVALVTPNMCTAP